jgi:hypothetical protein
MRTLLEHFFLIVGVDMILAIPLSTNGMGILGHGDTQRILLSLSDQLLTVSGNTSLRVGR